MDNQEKVTVLEGIITDCGVALFQRWANALPVEERTEEKLEPLSKNAADTAFFLIQMFMDKFNAEAEKLKD
jgi:hypothetical protein